MQHILVIVIYLLSQSFLNARVNLAVPSRSLESQTSEYFFLLVALFRETGRVCVCDRQISDRPTALNDVSVENSDIL